MLENQVNMQRRRGIILLISTSYACLFPEMIKEWRNQFSKEGGSDPNFPFGFVQLAGYDPLIS